jgi:hypothetical protein
VTPKRWQRASRNTPRWAWTPLCSRATRTSKKSYRFAELVFPLLPRKLRQKLPGQVLNGPFGEVVANEYLPRVSQS